VLALLAQLASIPADPGANAAHRLIDEYGLMLHPVIVGSGKRLFNGFEETPLRLADTTTTGTGVVVLTYATGADAPA
jgi:dihydrofolate reductase